MCKEENNTESQ